MTEMILTANQPEHYSAMLSVITKSLPAIAKSNQSFYKSDSQLKIATLDINDLTDIGAAKHILARIERKKSALKESDLSVRKQKVGLS